MKVVVVIIAVIQVCIIAAAIFFYFAKKKKEEAEISVDSKMKVTIPGMVTTEIEKPEEETQESLDMLYAKTNGMWVCVHCETLNGAHKRYCSACGYKNK